MVEEAPYPKNFTRTETHRIEGIDRFYTVITERNLDRIVFTTPVDEVLYLGERPLLRLNAGHVIALTDTITPQGKINTDQIALLPELAHRGILFHDYTDTRKTLRTVSAALDPVLLAHLITERKTYSSETGRDYNPIIQSDFPSAATVLIYVLGMQVANGPSFLQVPTNKDPMLQRVSFLEIDFQAQALEIFFKIATSKGLLTDILPLEKNHTSRTKIGLGNIENELKRYEEHKREPKYNDRLRQYKLDLIELLEFGVL